MRSPIAFALAFLAVLAPSCTDRTRPDSEHGRRLAEHLCAVQAACDCDEELLIPDCEARVLREFLVTEQRALDAGIELDEACFEEMLSYIDGLVACLPSSESPGLPCLVYTADADVGEPCQIYDFFPWMTECRADLRCSDGFCRGPANPQILHEGEICSETQADVPTGDLGRCAEGLDCDGNDTRTCIPSPYWPPIPTGEVCASLTPCVPESYCHTPEAEEIPSEENPGSVRRARPRASHAPISSSARRSAPMASARPRPRACAGRSRHGGRESGSESSAAVSGAPAVDPTPPGNPS